jgi:cobaltochelatase CobS
MPTYTYTALTELSLEDLRSAFRTLLNGGLARVPDEMRLDKTAAKWLASCKRSDLENLIALQGLRMQTLAAANAGNALPPIGEPTVVVEDPELKPVARVEPVKAGGDMSALANMIAPYLSIGMDEAKLRALVKETVKAQLDGTEPRVLVVQGPVKTMQTDDPRHQHLERLLRYVAQRKHVFLVGPAGTGKSHAAHQAANLLGLDFYSISVGLQSTQVDLFGYMNAHGTYVTTQFRQAYENGGVFCLDEMDGGSPNVLNALNSALANGSVAFPDRRVPRHANFVVVSTGNTWGTGKTLEYVGRAALDGAFLSRFARMLWPVDEKLERKLGPVPAWTLYVQEVRKLFDAKSIKAVIAPRISIDGGAMLLAGQSVEDTIADYIAAGLTQEARDLLPRPPRIEIPKVVPAAQEAA